MSGLLFKADYTSANSSLTNGEEGRARHLEHGREDVVGQRFVSVNGGTWRKKARAKAVGLPATSDVRGTTRPEPRSRSCGICCPTQFFCDEFSRRIEANRAHENQKWIFDLIDCPQETTETIYLDEEKWMLVQGSSYNVLDERYLVIFKDKTLKTIRDLRQSHLSMLEDVREKVVAWLNEEGKDVKQFKMYFHYLPSVFQLHMHVCSSSAGDSIRRQYLHCIVRNIEKKDEWYKDALILFAPPRAGRVNVVGNALVSDENAGDKPSVVCI